MTGREVAKAKQLLESKGYEISRPQMHESVTWDNAVYPGDDQDHMDATIGKYEFQVHEVREGTDYVELAPVGSAFLQIFDTEKGDYGDIVEIDGVNVDDHGYLYFDSPEDAMKAAEEFATTGKITVPTHSQSEYQ